MKKLLSLIVAAVLVLSLLPMGAIAAEVKKETPAVRAETIMNPSEGVKAPEKNKAPEAPVYRAEETLYSWDFSGDPEADGWQFIDRDGDGKNWRANTNYYHSGSPSMMSGSYDGSACNPDNWAITPAIELPETGTAALKYWVKGQSGNYPEVYGIYLGSTADPDSMTQIVDDAQTVGTDWIEMEVDLTDYLGETVYIAIVNHNCYDQWLIYIDDVSVVADVDGTPPTPTPEPTAVPDDLVGYYFESQAEADEWLFVDANGDGKNWSWREANANYPAYEGSGLIYSASFEGGAITPDNWAISPSVTVKSADSTVSMYIGARPGSSYYQEHVGIYAGSGNDVSAYELIDEFTLPSSAYQQYSYNLGDYEGEEISIAVRHFNCYDQYYVLLDQVEFFGVEAGEPVPTPEPPTPTPEPSPTPEPTEEPEGMVGYFFETDEDVAEWLMIDADGDGFIWERRDAAEYAYEGVGCLTSASYNNNVGPLHPDNWAISPSQKVVNEEAYFSFYIAAQDPSWYQEHIGIYIGSGGYIDNYELIDEFTLENAAWTQYTYTLEDYVGQEVSLAIRHFDCTDMFMVNVDMFVFMGTEEGEPVPEPDPTPTPEPTPAPEGLIQGYYFEAEAELDDWTFTDEDGDGHTWQWINNIADFEAYEGVGLLGSASWTNGAALEPDNYAIVGPIQLLDIDNELTFYAAGIGNDWCEEHFAVYIGLSSDPAEMEELIGETVATANYVEYSASLDDYAGEEVYVAFRHFNCTDMNWLRLDQVEFWGYEDDVEAELITTVAIENFIEPAWGENPFFDVTVPDDAPYTIEVKEWFEDGDDFIYMAEDDIFNNENAQYFMYFEIVADEGYSFAEWVTVTINGDENMTSYISLGDYPDHLYVETIMFTVEPEPVYIDTVEILDFVEPAWGENPFFDVTVPDDAPYTIEEIEWYDDNDFNPLAPDAVFDNEETIYYAYIFITPNEGYEFAEELTVLINGEETFIDPEYTEWYAEGVYVWTIDFTVERELIDAVEVNELDIPEWGANPDFEVVVPEGAPYGIKSVYWFTIDEEEEDVELGVGYEFNDPEEEYYVLIMVEPAEGYKFDENVTALLNNGELEIMDYYVEEDGMLWIYAGPFTVEEPEPDVIWGDADGDGESTLEDALLLMRYIINLDTVDEENLACCDVNGDGVVDLADALLIMRKAMGTIEAFPVE